MKLIFATFAFLNKKDRYYLLALVALIVFTAFIELLGVGALFPYIKILSDPNILQNNHIANRIYQTLHMHSLHRFYVLLGVFVFLLVLFKGFLSVLNNYFQTDFASKIKKRLSSYSLSTYLHLPYDQVIYENSSVLSKKLLHDVAYAVQVFTSMLSVLTDAIISITLIALVIWVNPTLILAVSVFLFLVMWVSILSTRNRMRKNALETSEAHEKTFEWAACTLSGLKDIKAYHVESYFLKKFLYWADRLGHLEVGYMVISNLPSNIMNVMGFGVLLGVLLYLIVTDGNLMAVLPTIGVLAIAVQRLLPTAGRISVATSLIKRYSPCVFAVKEAFSEFANKQIDIVASQNFFKEVKFQTVLEWRSVSFRYPDQTQLALENISFQLKKNSSLGIVGASGAGKSTLIDVLLGLLPIASGDILCDGVSIVHNKMAALRHLVGYVPQQTHLLDASIAENIAFGIEEADIDPAAIAQALEIAQLTHFIATLPKGVHTRIGEKGVRLSGGQRQRIGIARALYHNPDILIMDEATSALDIATEREFNHALQYLMGKKTLIIIAHRQVSVRFCHSLLVLEKGRLVGVGSHEVLMQECPAYQHLYQHN